MSPAYTTSRDVMVEQVQGTYHGPWIKSDASESNNTKSHTNYREISTWATLPKSVRIPTLNLTYHYIKKSFVSV